MENEKPECESGVRSFVSYEVPACPEMQKILDMIIGTKDDVDAVGNDPEETPLNSLGEFPTTAELIKRQYYKDK